MLLPIVALSLNARIDVVRPVPDRIVVAGPLIERRWICFEVTIVDELYVPAAT